MVKYSSPNNQSDCPPLVPSNIPKDVTEKDRQRFFEVISTQLDERQVQQIINPPKVYPRQKQVLAVHWHPEFVPFDLIEQRIEKLFPHRENELIIPTQHNQLMDYKNYAGVEVDCYSSAFNQKVQLLLHFKAEHIKEESILHEMLNHTFKYRSSQLFEFMHAITAPKQEYLDFAAKETGANPAIVQFVQIYVKKIESLLEENMDHVPPLSVKNKLLRNYFDSLREEHGDILINRVQAFLKTVKVMVKAHFPLSYFYRTSEVIEEARHHRAGIVVPHPEQFWPILMANYDVDGYEVWNPQSQRYTNFLISVLNEQNQHRPAGRKPLLLFMGDDTHMGEKTRDISQQKGEKADREMGLQPAWDDLSIRKNLITMRLNRKRLIAEYKARLDG